MFEERVDLSNDTTWRQMIAVGVRRVVLVREESGLGNRTHTTQKYNILPQSTTSDFARRA